MKDLSLDVKSISWDTLLHLLFLSLLFFFSFYFLCPFTFFPPPPLHHLRSLNNLFNIFPKYKISDMIRNLAIWKYVREVLKKCLFLKYFLFHSQKNTALIIFISTDIFCIFPCLSHVLTMLLGGVAKWIPIKPTMQCLAVRPNMAV